MQALGIESPASSKGETLSIKRVSSCRTVRPPADEGPTSPAIQSLAARTRRIKSASPYGHLPGWKLDGLIAKSNDDVRQEVTAAFEQLVVVDGVQESADGSTDLRPIPRGHRLLSLPRDTLSNFHKA